MDVQFNTSPRQADVHIFTWAEDTHISLINLLPFIDFVPQFYFGIKEDLGVSANLESSSFSCSYDYLNAI